MKLKQIISYVSVLAWPLTFLLPKIARADVTDPLVFEPQVGLPGILRATTTMSRSDTSYIGQLAKGFYDYGLAIGGILAAIMLMAGGVIWLTSAGSSDAVSKAKGLIAGSITGLVLLFGAWFMLNTINPALIDFNIRSIKGVVAIYLMDGKDGIIDTMESLPKDTEIKFLCLGANQVCTDTTPPSINLDISICKKELPDITCSGNTPQKWCCGVSQEVNEVINEACKNEANNTPCQLTPTDTGLSGFCFDKQCYGGKVCCECFRQRIPTSGVYVYKFCNNDVTMQECRDLCKSNLWDWLSVFYPGGSNNYTCSEGAYSSCDRK